MTPDSHKQIAYALQLLANDDLKENLIKIITNNFAVFEKDFDAFKFVKQCYIPNGFSVYDCISSELVREIKLDQKLTEVMRAHINNADKLDARRRA